MLAFKKEQSLEIWTADENPTKLVSKFPLDIHPLTPIGIFQLPPILNVGTQIAIDYPNAYYLRKKQTNTKMITDALFISADPSSYLSTKSDKLDKIIDIVAGTQASSIVIAPNDIRYGQHFVTCARCPSWTPEIWGSIELFLADYK